MKDKLEFYNEHTILAVVSFGDIIKINRVVIDSISIIQPSFDDVYKLTILVNTSFFKVFESKDASIIIEAFNELIVWWKHGIMPTKHGEIIKEEK
jgi:hypothetical protein